MRVAGLIAVLAALVATPVASAAEANGGGRGTVDGTTPFSQFGFGARSEAAGIVTGHFNCLMAGASEFPGFDLMAVRGELETGTIGTASAVLSGSGMFQTGNQGKQPATFTAVVTEGGPGVGTLQLTLWTPFLFVLPVERVLDGRISIR
jgi:hypothetical protein